MPAPLRGGRLPAATRCRAIMARFPLISQQSAAPPADCFSRGESHSNKKQGCRFRSASLFLYCFYCALDPSVTASVSTLPSRSTWRLTVSPMPLSFR